jgi:hypothetical protein
MRPRFISLGRTAWARAELLLTSGCYETRLSCSIVIFAVTPPLPITLQSPTTSLSATFAASKDHICDHPLLRLRPPGLVPSYNRRDGLESDSRAVESDQALCELPCHGRVAQTNVCSICTRSVICGADVRPQEIPGTDDDDNRVQFGSNPSTGESRYPLELTIEDCG